MKILDLFLKHKFYNMIDCGFKTEEYRDITPYWINRIVNGKPTHIRFHKGYTKTTMIFEILDIFPDFGKPEWGAPDHEVFVIVLGERIKLI